MAGSRKKNLSFRELNVTRPHLKILLLIVAFTYIGNVHNFATASSFGFSSTNTDSVTLKHTPGPFAVSPDGMDAYITFSDEVGTGNSFSGIEVVSMKPLKTVNVIPVPGQVTDIAISPNGVYLYVSRICGAANNCPSSLAVINAKTEKIVKSVGTYNSSTNVNVSPDGRLVYLWSPGLMTINLATGRVLGSSDEQVTAPSDVALNANGTLLYALSGESTGGSSLVIVNTSTEKTVAKINYPYSHTATSTYVEPSPNGQSAYVSYVDKVIKELNAKTGNIISTLAQNQGTYGLAFSRTGKFLYTAENCVKTCAIGVIDTQTKKSVAEIELTDRSLSLNQLTLSRNGQYLFATDFNQHFVVAKVPSQFR